MRKFIQPGSGADDMGAGIASGCLKRAGIAVVVIIVIGLLIKYVF